MITGTVVNGSSNGCGDRHNLVDLAFDDSRWCRCVSNSVVQMVAVKVAIKVAVTVRRVCFSIVSCFEMQV